MSIDEAIKLTKQHNKCQYSEANECLSEEDCSYCDKYYDSKKWDEFCKQLPDLLEELKAYKELDLEIPQHFTKEQSDWIKKYVILKKKEAKVEAIDEFLNRVVSLRIYDNDLNLSDLELVTEKMKEGAENA